MAKMTITSPVRHDGAVYAIGAQIECDKEAADRLARLGVAEAVAEDLSALKKAELQEKLDAAGVEYDPKMTKDELLALLEG